MENSLDISITYSLYSFICLFTTTAHSSVTPGGREMAKLFSTLAKHCLPIGDVKVLGLSPIKGARLIDSAAPSTLGCRNL